MFTIYIHISSLGFGHLLSRHKVMCWSWISSRFSSRISLKQTVFETDYVIVGCGPLVGWLWPPGGPHILSLGLIPTPKPSFTQPLLRKPTPDKLANGLRFVQGFSLCLFFFFARWFSSLMLSVVGSNCSLAASRCVERKWFGMGEVKDMKREKWNDQDRDTEASWTPKLSCLV